MKLYSTLVLLFSLLALVLGGSAQTVNIGITNLLPNVDQGNAGLIMAQETTLSQAATLQSISFYIQTVDGTVRLGLYDSTGTQGTPGNKLAETPAITPSAGWNAVPVLTPASLAPGTYWLAYEAETNSAQYLTIYNVGSIVFAAQTFGDLPTTFPASPVSSAGQWSFYATLGTNQPDAPAPVMPGYVQGNYAAPQSPVAIVNVPYVAVQNAGDLNVVIVGWSDSTAKVSSLTDSAGNLYLLASSPTVQTGSGPLSQSIYYAPNISASGAGANAVTLTFNTPAVFPDIRILEYSGIDPLNPLDVSASQAGNSATSGSNPVTTGNAVDLLVGANTVWTQTVGPGSGFTQRLLTSPDGDIAEDGVVTTLDSYSATASLGTPGSWIMQMAAFRAAGSPSPTPSPAPTPASPTGITYPLKVSSNKRYLVDQNSVPVMVVGDSAWSLMTNLTEAQAASYFADRKANGFNTVLLSLFVGDGIFGRSDFSTYDGIVPFTTPGDFSTPNPAYFQRVDEMINLAASFGLCVFLNPIENYGWEATFQSAGQAECAAFGTYLGNRYKNFPNIVWSSGNDYQDWPAADTVFLAIVNAIKAVDTNHLHTMELNYNNSSPFDDPRWVAPVVDLNWSYTYFPAYAEDLHCYSAKPVTPYILGESIYEQEDHQTTDSGTVENLRREAWWTACSGAAGQLYGSAWTDAFPTGWQNNLDTPGAIQLGYLAAILQPLAWYNLVPDTTHTFVTSGYGTQYPYPGNPAGNAKGTLGVDTFVAAAITPDGTLGIAYLPAATTVTVDLSKFSGPVTAQWIDPSTGVATKIADSPLAPTGSREFASPGHTADGQNDWVLLFTR
jgi:hypothetical protein